MPAFRFFVLITAALNYPHRLDAVVSASGFNTAKEQWECSVSRFTGPLYFLIKPVNLLFIHFKYGADKNLSAVSGINKVQIPLLVISAENDIFYGGETSLKNNINKNLYIEHDKAILEMICSFFTN